MKGITAASGSVSMRTLRKHQLSWKFLLGQQQVNINMFITEFRVMSYRKKASAAGAISSQSIMYGVLKVQKDALIERISYLNQNVILSGCYSNISWEINYSNC